VDCQSSLAFTSGSCTPQQCESTPIENTLGNKVCEGATGDTCQYSCQSGYHDTGSGVVSCEAGGQFSSGGCTATACRSEIVQHTTSGTTTCSGVTGDTCSYTCADGYSTSGRTSGTMSCQPSGSFSAGECAANRCSPQPISHTTDQGGSKTCSGVTGDTCPFTCARGYSVSGGTVTCQPSGEFSDGGCVAAGCETKLIQYTSDSSGSKTCTGVTGETCEYTCANGYHDTGSGTVTCRASGQFTAGSCAPDTCSLQSIEHTSASGGGSITRCSGATGATCSFTCADGYQSYQGTGSGQTVCQWSDAAGQVQFTEPWDDGSACVPMQCAPLQIQHTTQVSGTVCRGSTDDPAPCLYTCKDGFTDSNSGPQRGRTSCQPQGKSPIPPAFLPAECTAQPCEDESIEFTTAGTGGTTTCHGSTEDTCDFTCAAGFQDTFADLSSGTNVRRTITCLANHSWSEARCERKSCLLPNGDSGPVSTTAGEGITHSAPSSTAEWSQSAQTTCAPGAGFASKTGDVCTFFCARGYGVHGSKDELGGQTTCKANGDSDPEYDTVACTDIDECAIDNAGCSGRCHNTDGSFYCGACDNSGSSAWDSSDPACCAGGTRTAWPSYGPTELCCNPEASGECTTGTPGACDPAHSWLQNGCIGSPTPSTTVVQLFSSVDSAAWLDGQWSLGGFSAGTGATVTVPAGTALIVAIDAKDTLGSRDAELASLCQASSFQVSSDPDLTQLPSLVETTPAFYANVSITTEDPSFASQYYASRLKATVTGQYTVSVLLTERDPAAHVTPSSTVNVVPAELSTANCLVHGQNVLSVQCISGACKSRPSTQLEFNVAIFDEFGNSRTNQDQDNLYIAVDGAEVRDADQGVSCCADGCDTYGDNCVVYADESDSYSVHMMATQDNPQQLLVTIQVSSEILQSFNYTAANLAPDEVNKLLSIRADREARPCATPIGPSQHGDRCIEAGATDAFTVVVTDDQCQGKQQCTYTPHTPEACCAPHRGRSHKQACTKPCVADPCGMPNQCACPVYTASVGCVQSYGLASGASGIHIVAKASRGVLLPPYPLPVYDTTGGYSASDCSDASGDCFSSTCSSAASGVPNPACLDFGFVATLAGVYQVSLALGAEGKCLGDDGECLDLSNGLSTWYVRVSPTSLDHDQSQPGPLFDFDTSEAGRNMTFFVEPRDRYGNLRDQRSAFELTGGKDALHLNVSGPTSSGPIAQPWNVTTHRFTAAQLLTVSGDYTFSVQLSDSDISAPVIFKLLSRNVIVIPAVLDVANTVVELYTAAADVQGGDYNSVIEGTAHYRYSGETTAGGGCQSARNSSECAEACAASERCNFFWFTTSSSVDRSSSCCLVESYDSSSSQLPPDSKANFYRLVRGAEPGLPRPTLAGFANRYRFSARDRYGNVRLQNDTCVATIDDASIAAAPSAQLAAPLWDSTQRPEQPGLRPALLPGYIVSFTTETARNYSITVTLAPAERHDGGAVHAEAVPGSPFHVTVWPAQIDISSSSQPGPEFPNYLPLDPTDLCGSPCRQTVAGASNNFTIVPRDSFGNVQTRHPSVFALETPDAMFVRMGCSSMPVDALSLSQDHWCSYNVTLANSTRCIASKSREYTCADTRWRNIDDGRFESQMITSSPTIAGIYTLDVTLGYAHDDSELTARTWGVREPFVRPSVWPQTREYAERTISNGNSNAPFTVFVRPTELSHSHSSPNNGVDPAMFNSTEAGRNCSFAIVPRDRFSNIRDQTLLGFSDVVSVDLTARQCPYMVECSDPRCEGGLCAPVVNAETYWTSHSPLPNSTTLRPHFRASFIATAAGVYHLRVQLESTLSANDGVAPLAGLHSVPQQMVGTAQGADGYILIVIPAKLDPANTFFLSLFSKETHGTPTLNCCICYPCWLSGSL
jgi:hypothetical protein